MSAIYRPDTSQRTRVGYAILVVTTRTRPPPVRRICSSATVVLRVVGEKNEKNRTSTVGRDTRAIANDGVWFRVTNAAAREKNDLSAITRTSDD